MSILSVILHIVHMIPVTQLGRYIRQTTNRLTGIHSYSMTIFSVFTEYFECLSFTEVLGLLRLKIQLA